MTTPNKPYWGSYANACSGWSDEADARLASAKPRPTQPEAPVPPTTFIIVALALAIVSVVIGTAMPEFESCPADICSAELEDVR